MAAALPPIQSVSNPHQAVRVSVLSKKDTQENTVAPAKQGLAGLTDLDIARHRQSYLHNTSVALLEEGYVNSFIEIFSLVESQKMQRELAGRDSGHYYDPLLPAEPSKLETLAKHLGLAEKLQRQGKLAEVCGTLDNLAQECRQTDSWLADHFYKKSLSISELIEGDEGRKLAESHKNLGLMHEFQNSLLQAIQDLEAYFKLCQKHGQTWHTDHGENIMDDACEQLRRVYTKHADTLQSTDPVAAIEYVQRAYDVIKLSSYIDKQAEACYLLGVAYREAKEYKTALKQFKSYHEKAKHNRDDEGVIHACEAVSDTYQLMGEFMRAAEYQKKILEASQKAGINTAYTKACASLGGIYNRLGLYEESVTYFESSSEDSTAMSGGVSNVQFGVANAHHQMDTYLDHVLDYSVQTDLGIASFKDEHDGLINVSEDYTGSQEGEGDN